MDTSLPQSKSIPSNLSASWRDRVSISGSGSYQSHLSSLGHLYRVRSTSEQVSLSFALPDKDHLHMLEEGLPEQMPRMGRLCLLKQSLTDPATFLSDDLRRILGGHVWRARTLFSLYCCLSVLFLSSKVCTFSRQVLQAAQPPHLRSWSFFPSLVHGADNHGTSAPLMDVSLSQRLSVAFRGLSPQAHLETFAPQAHPGYNSDLTACLWIEDTRIEEALVSATKWPGPVSLLVVTTNPPNSTAYKRLLSSFSTTHASNAGVHVLYVPSVAGSSSNAYLNMARFFARTRHVVLFPDGIPESATTRAWLDALPARHPVLLSNVTHRGFSPSPLAPLALPRDDPVWCTERLYMFGSRVQDWEDCLWGVWLESAGEASAIGVPHLDDKNVTRVPVPPFAVRVVLIFAAVSLLSVLFR